MSGLELASSRVKRVSLRPCATTLLLFAVVVIAATADGFITTDRTSFPLSDVENPLTEVKVGDVELLRLIRLTPAPPKSYIVSDPGHIAEVLKLSLAAEFKDTTFVQMGAGRQIECFVFLSGRITPIHLGVTVRNGEAVILYDPSGRRKAIAVSSELVEVLRRLTAPGQ